MGAPTLAIMAFLATALCFVAAATAAKALAVLVGEALRRRRLRHALPRDWWDSFQRELDEYTSAEQRRAREAERRR